jgi:hypothetical protein
MLRRLALSTALVLVPIAALADTAANIAPITAIPVITTGTTTIDLAWVANVGWGLASIAITALAGYAVTWLQNSKFLANNAAAKAHLEGALQSGAALAANELQQIHIASAPVAIKNAALARGTNFAIAGAAASAKLLGYDPSTPEGQLHIANMIEARVPAAQAKSGVYSPIPVDESGLSTGTSIVSASAVADLGSPHQAGA